MQKVTETFLFPVHRKYNM